MANEERMAQIKARIEKLDADRKIIEMRWAQNVKEVTNDPKFDPFSRKGGKVLRKVADKYTPMFVDIDFEREELVEEYNGYIDLMKNSKKND